MCLCGGLCGWWAIKPDTGRDVAGGCLVKVVVREQHDEAWCLCVGMGGRRMVAARYGKEAYDGEDGEGRRRRPERLLLAAVGVVAAERDCLVAGAGGKLRDCGGCGMMRV